MVLHRGLIVLFGGFHRAIKKPQADASIVFVNPGPPTFPLDVPTDAFEFGSMGLFSRLWKVAVVLGPGADAEIRPSIVRTIPVPVIDQHVVRGLHDEPMEQETFLLAGPFDLNVTF